MSCLGANYNPKPTRDWTRFENTYIYNTSSSLEKLAIEQMYRKGNILQYRANSCFLTRTQKYSQIAKGRSWTNRSRTYAVQNQEFTDANTCSLARRNYTNLDISAKPVPVATTEPITPCPTAIINTFNNLPTTGQVTSGIGDDNIAKPKPTGGGGGILLPSGIKTVPTDKPTIIANGGNLICNLVENKCSGAIEKVNVLEKCYSARYSDVPSDNLLCWDDSLQTYYTKQFRTYPSGGRGSIL